MQQYNFTERVELLKTITFSNSLPLHVKKILYFKEEEITGSFTKKEFRYSFDHAVWTNWNTLTQSNLVNIEFKDKPDFWLEVRYTRTGLGSGNILRWYLYYEEISNTPPVPPSDASIDADTLKGEGPEYYLNRENHFGPYTDLNVENVPDGSTIGVYHGRLDTSLGTTLYFKRLKGEGGVLISEASSGIISIETDPSSSSSGVYNSTLDPSLAMTSAVGGFPAGTKVYDLVGDTFTSMWDALLFPTVNPTFVAPSSSLSKDVSSLLEIGTILNVTFTNTFNRGQILLNGNFQNYRSGLATSYNFGGDVISGTGVSNSRTASSYGIVQGIKTWTSSANYSVGPQPYDNKGNPYSSPLPAGTTSNSSTTIEGVYPLFATTVNITTLTKQTLVSMISANNIAFTMVPESGGNKQKFEIPLTWLTSRPLVGIQNFNTFSSQWEYEGGSAAQSLLRWTTSSSSETIQGNSVFYTKYTYNSTDRGTIQIRLVF